MNSSEQPISEFIRGGRLHGQTTVYPQAIMECRLCLAAQLGQTHLFNIWIIGAMDRTLGQTQVKPILLRNISLKIRPQYIPATKKRTTQRGVGVRWQQKSSGLFRYFFSLRTLLCSLFRNEGMQMLPSVLFRAHKTAKESIIWRKLISK